jgi:nitroimidazol reductase NimA-like FMN-containing flavoprotein (pyridoxamine 5'-phosphate oxidase superfamily)
MSVANYGEFLKGRYIASLGTENPDGLIHLTAVWYLFEAGRIYIATSSRSRKARNVAARGKASLMVDTRRPGAERAVVGMGHAEIITGAESRELNLRILRRYLSEAALADPLVRQRFEAIDDVTLRLTPTSWYQWDMRELGEAVFEGALNKPGYLLPLD